MRNAILVTAWAIALGTGFGSMLDYEMTAGDPGSPPSAWPYSADFRVQPDVPILLLFAHPKCPCTRATLSELARLLTHCGDRLETHVIFLKPESKPDDWERTDLWVTAGRIPRVNLITDDGGRLATMFSATTSGSTLLYDTHGQLVFCGGITASRGHEGDNTGRSTITAWLNGRQPQCTTSPVFGCSLCEKSRLRTGKTNP